MLPVRIKVRVHDEPACQPAVVNGVVYAGSQDHSLYACDATTGEKLWTVEVELTKCPETD